MPNSLNKLISNEIEDAVAKLLERNEGGFPQDIIDKLKRELHPDRVKQEMFDTSPQR